MSASWLSFQKAVCSLSKQGHHLFNLVLPRDPSSTQFERVHLNTYGCGREHNVLFKNTRQLFTDKTINPQNKSSTSRMENKHN